MTLKDMPVNEEGVGLDSAFLAIRELAAADTSNDPTSWTPENPTHGHCAVAALVLQELFGGEVVRGAWSDRPELGSHYWNRIYRDHDTNSEPGDVDATWEQFPDGTPTPDLSRVRFRQDMLADPNTRRRHRIFRGRVMARLGVIHTP